MGRRVTAAWSTPLALHGPQGLPLAPWMPAGHLLCQAPPWDGGFRGDPASNSTCLCCFPGRSTGKTKSLRDLGVCQLLCRFWSRRPRLEAQGWCDCFSEGLVGSLLRVCLDQLWDKADT